MQPIDINKHLWRDSKSVDQFIKAVTLFRQAASKDEIDSSEILISCNMLDDMMQQYEAQYCPIEDPLFYWWFASANALFLQVGKSFDELGSARIGYIVNGYKEAFTKHLLYPTLTAELLTVAYENLEQFANDHDKKWISNNRSKFKPIAD